MKGATTSPGHPRVAPPPPRPDHLFWPSRACLGGSALSRPSPGWGRGYSQAGARPPLLSPVRAPPLQEGPGRGHRPVTETENGAENPNQPFVHTRPKQQRRPTHPETQTPELSPPLPPSPPRPPPPKLRRRLVTRSEDPVGRISNTALPVISCANLDTSVSHSVPPFSHLERLFKLKFAGAPGWLSRLSISLGLRS